MSRIALTRLLVANRAEIASRVFRTCRRLPCVADQTAESTAGQVAHQQRRLGGLAELNRTARHSTQFESARGVSDNGEVDHQ